VNADAVRLMDKQGAISYPDLLLIQTQEEEYKRLARRARGRAKRAALKQDKPTDAGQIKVEKAKTSRPGKGRKSKKSSEASSGMASTPVSEEISAQIDKMEDVTDLVRLMSDVTTRINERIKKLQA
jgi:hypothetical protein